MTITHGLKCPSTDTQSAWSDVRCTSTDFRHLLRSSTVQPIDLSEVGTDGTSVQGQIQGPLTLVDQDNQEAKWIYNYQNHSQCHSPSALCVY